MRATLGALPVYPDSRLAVGQLIGFEGGLWAHPLDVIAFQHGHDALTRLDAAIAYLLDRAMRRLDAAEARLGGEPD